MNPHQESCEMQVFELVCLLISIPLVFLNIWLHLKARTHPLSTKIWI
jgi:hypothetical protein